MSKFLAARYSLLAMLLVGGPLLRAAAAAPDSDGDGLPDDGDPRPTLADFPLYWTVESLTFHWLPPRDNSSVTSGAPAWAAAETLILRERAGQGAAAGSRTAAARTAHALETPAVTNLPSVDAAAACGLFGSGEVAWLTPQRERARRLAANPTRAGRGARLEFGVALRNRGAAACRLDRLRVPVRLAGRRLAEARPADPAMRERGIVLPADNQARHVVFVADIAPRHLARLLEGLREESPCLQLEAAEGAILQVSGASAVNLAARLRVIRERTETVKVRDGDGAILAWRAARALADRPQRLCDWAAALNTALRERTGRDFWHERDGLLTSLNGWDTGAWDRWWHVRRPGRGTPSADWGRLPLDRATVFELRAAPPALPEKLAARLAAGADDPILTAWRGRMAWLRGDCAAASEVYRLAAAAGYAPALNWLGYCCQEGKGIASNGVEAVSHFRRAAEQGYAPGAAWLGRCYLRGQGVARDPAAATAWLGRAAAQGHPEGAALYALCLMRGVGLQADSERAWRLLRSTAAQDGATAQMALGVQLLAGGDGEAVDWLRCAAAQGEAKAQTRLGACLWEGTGVGRDRREAMRWFAAAAAQGESEAQLALARGLRAGVGVKRDEKEAAVWFARAAEQGNAEAQTWLGMMLIDGRGVRLDRAAGLEWVRRAAAQDYAFGHYLLGLCHYAGLGTPKDDVQALACFQRAAAQRVAAAQVFAGFCYYEGRGVEQDRARAAGLFRQAAEQGSAIGQVWLAFCHAEGAGVERDPTLARAWAQQAARQGHPGGFAMLRRIARD